MDRLRKIRVERRLEDADLPGAHWEVELEKELVVLAHERTHACDEVIEVIKVSCRLQLSFKCICQASKRYQTWLFWCS